MGRLIDIDEARKEYSNLTDLTMSDTTLLLTLFGVLDNAPTVEAIPKDQYEARLKADMVAMLIDLQLEIEECEDCGRAFHLGLQMASKTIQKKINKLKENKDGKDN